MCTCVENIAKWFLLITNCITFLGALAVLGVSIWILVDQPSFLKVLNLTDDVDLQIYQSATIILLVIAVLVIIVTFFGCCGAAQESRCLLATYFGLDILLLIGAGVGAYFVFTGQLDVLKEPFMEALRKYDDTSNVASDKTLVSAWDAFQQDFRCCGVDDFADWSEENELFGGTPKSWVTTSRPDYNPRPERRVPESCCDSSSNQEYCATQGTTISGVYAKGCFTLVVEQIEDHEAIIGSVAIVVAAVMVINAFISIYMATCGYYDVDSRPAKRHYRRPVYQ